MIPESANALTIKPSDFKECDILILIKSRLFQLSDEKIMKTIWHEIAHHFLNHKFDEIFDNEQREIGAYQGSRS